MREQPKASVGGNGLIARRSLLTGALAAWVGASCRAGEPAQSQNEEDQERRQVEAIAAKAGLRSFGTTRSSHYLGIGDASDTFQSLTLRDCEALAADYLDYYQSQGFKVAMPAGRLTVIILTDERSLTAFNRDGRSQTSLTEANRLTTVPGRYNSHTNRLVVLDLHAVTSRRTGLLNLQLLAHEATHQLTFNTGLLNRRGDVPHSVGEGLAQYGEIRKTTGRTAPGQLHLRNLNTLATARRMDTPWYPVAQLLADDRPFLLDSFARLKNLAYAQAWLLIDYLMKDRSRLERFRAYLEAIRPRIDPEYRLDDAEKHLGDLDRLNQDLLTYFVKLNKSH
jgi:Protein of unknown function (DUF1570)